VSEQRAYRACIGNYMCGRGRQLTDPRGFGDLGIDGENLDVCAVLRERDDLRTVQDLKNKSGLAGRFDARCYHEYVNIAVMSAPSNDLLAGVSVVVPSYQGVAHLGACLDSLAAQTMDPDLFEVIVVCNGRPDGSRQLVIEHAALYPRITWRIVELLDRPGVGRARNVGIALARHAFIALIDDDDTVTPDYLAALYSHAAWAVVPMAWLDDVAADGTVNESTPVNRALTQVAGQTIGAEAAPTLLSLNACKLLPLSLVRRVGYDIEVRSGVDVEFLTQLYAAGRFRIHALRRDEGAIYRRSLRPGSVSRQECTFEFSVEGRLDVIQRISQHALSPHTDVQVVARTMIAAQAGFMRRYLATAPGDRKRVIDAIDNRDLPWFAWSALNRGQARRLAISYCFVPYAGTAAIVAGKRIREAAEVVDVICNAMDSVHAIDVSTRVIADPYIDREMVIATPTLFGAWRAIDTFCEQGWAAIEAAEAAKGPYTSIWSRAMWPASHALAALHTVRRPGTPWVAEFSDPLSRNVKGERRTGMIVEGDIARELIGGLTDAGVAVAEDVTLFELCELLAYALATELHFTNPNQLEFMLSYCPPELKATVRGKARVVPQPTLPRRFYAMADANDHRLSTERVNVGYFGAFYISRGIGEILDAIDQLSPSERDRILLHVFTSDPHALIESVASRSAASALTIEGYRPYLQFLALSCRMDALLVNDAATSGSAHSINPYLPSKYSDYRGAGTMVWGHIEPGSPLSQAELDLVSRVGAVDSVIEVLRDLLAMQDTARRTGDRAQSPGHSSMSVRTRALGLSARSLHDGATLGGL
jgi:poly(ribitol-phosphate) beta-N-acetylglucosaminyltransferase